MFGGISMLVNALCLCLIFTNVHAFLWLNETHCPAEAFAVASSISFEGDRTSECPCLTKACLSMCRPTMLRSAKTNTSGMRFPTIHDPVTLESRPEGIGIEDFHVVTWDPCHGGRKYILRPEYKFLANGSIYRVVPSTVINYTNYCFGAISGDTYSVILCASKKDMEAAARPKVKVGFPIGTVVSVPLLLAVFVVYSIVPELRNMHGATLRGYVAALIATYTVLSFLLIISPDEINDGPCVSLAFVLYFSFMATFFWLNVICFDIWWTFRRFKSPLSNSRQQERKTFIIYSIYAWGIPTLLTGVCLIMDFIPSVPRGFIRPQIGVRRCWFATHVEGAFYFYSPMGVTVICNVYFFISTVMKIIQHKKDTAHHLEGIDSQRHNDNKQRFNLYLKLFIMMGVSWSMDIIGWLCDSEPRYVWYIWEMATNFQGLLIFITFIWNGKIKRLLLKRLGCEDRSFRWRTSARSGCRSSTSKIPTSPAVMTQEKVNPRGAPKTSTDESDCDYRS